MHLRVFGPPLGLEGHEAVVDAVVHPERPRGIGGLVDEARKAPQECKASRGVEHPDESEREDPDDPGREALPQPGCDAPAADGVDADPHPDGCY